MKCPLVFKGTAGLILVQLTNCVVFCDREELANQQTLEPKVFTGRVKSACCDAFLLGQTSLPFLLDKQKKKEREVMTFSMIFCTSQTTMY